MDGIGLYGELLEPKIPQYRAAKSIIKTLEAAKVESLFIERSGHVILLEPERDRAAEAIVNFIELNAGLNS